MSVEHALTLGSGKGVLNLTEKKRLVTLVLMVLFVIRISLDLT